MKWWKVKAVHLQHSYAREVQKHYRKIILSVRSIEAVYTAFVLILYSYADSILLLPLGTCSPTDVTVCWCQVVFHRQWRLITMIPRADDPPPPQPPQSLLPAESDIWWCTGLVKSQNIQCLIYFNTIILYLSLSMWQVDLTCNNEEWLF